MSAGLPVNANGMMTRMNQLLTMLLDREPKQLEG
jgi:hypothetical protein